MPGASKLDARTASSIVDQRASKREGSLAGLVLRFEHVTGEGTGPRGLAAPVTPFRSPKAHSMQRVAILGASGSVGQSTLRLLEERRDRFDVVLMSAHRSSDALFGDAAAFATPHVALTGFERASDVPGAAPDKSTLHLGPQGLIEALEACEPDMVLNAITGSAGLQASAWTLRNGLHLLLANKESLVVAGPLLRELERAHGGRILPVDSEHAAIHQCLRGERRDELRRVLLTASGGPLRELAPEHFADVSVEQALAHPTWKMGPRITIGSATLMNKAFEVLEAHHLFDLERADIDVVVHPQSIVHSMVEFCDGSIMAQLGVPDMRVPILYCLGWPDRVPFEFEGFDLAKWGKLSFEAVDHERFPALELGYRCVELGHDAGAVLNAADEVATHAFLEGRIAFPQITESVENVLEGHNVTPIESVEQVLDVDARARRAALNWIETH